MKFTIKQFVFVLLFFSLSCLYAAFSHYYFVQRELTAQVITDSIQDDLSELSYILAKHLRKETIGTAKSLIDRKAVNNHYLRSIAVFDDDKLLITTDHRYSEAISPSQEYTDTTDNIYAELFNKVAFEGTIHYYQGKNIKYYTLVMFIDHELIDAKFSQARNQFLVLFVLIPFILLLFFWLFVSIFITKPLELLRQYAYYQSTVPSPFHIKEIEYIRASMVQTFFRLEQEKKDLYNLSITDSLSGLANRYYLQERLKQIISQCQRNDNEFALLFLDLDHFKIVNDSLGHDVGDELLKSVAHTIKDILRANDVVARIGGDEFVIVLTHYKDEIELVEVIQRIQSTLSKPWNIQTFPINITSSIGISIYPKDGDDLLSLMKNSDIAMYEAKARGRNGYHFFTEALNIKTQEYIQLTNSMKLALKSNQYQLFYQPQNNVKTGKIIGAEALIRWITEEGKIIPPNRFIPIAENNGFIVELGKWILVSAFKQKQQWEAQGINIKLSINVAAKQIQDENFVAELQVLLNEYKVNPAQIILEITEYIFLHDSDYVYKTFKEIKALGVQISLDDFGTGYSSLSYLKKFPIDNLKIDKAFLDDYNSEQGAVFIETIISMAHSLKLGVVAEGVEEQAQVDYLYSLSCDCFQGYFCSKPIVIDDFNQLYWQQK